MKKAMITGVQISAGLLGLFGILNRMTGKGLFLSLAITAGTFCYHMAMRLAAGWAIEGIFHNRISWKRSWFRPRSWEKGLYKALKVRAWKGKMPTFQPESFDIRHRSTEEILMATCQAELVHEIIALLSFLPVCAVPFAGALPVFLITSLVAAGADLSFAVIQRYNRPRLLRILEKEGRA